MRSYQRQVLSGTVALTLVSACVGAPLPPGATSGAAGTSRTSVGSTRSVDLQHRNAGQERSNGVDGSSTRDSETPVLSSKNPSLPMLPSNLDPAKMLLGRVIVPPGILSNNGGNLISDRGGAVIGENGAGIVGQNGANIVGQNGANATIQNGGNLISRDGAGIIGQNGANIISNNGSGFSLGQKPLAYASVRLTDAAGNTRLGPDGKPFVVQADERGQFYIPRDAIVENTIISATSSSISGELKAFIERGGTGLQELDVDIVSTMSSSFVLERYVKGDQQTLNRLNSKIESEARINIAHSLVAQDDQLISSLNTSHLLAAVEKLKSQDASVDDVLDRIEKLLVIAGIVNDGDGLLASELPLGEVTGMTSSPDGIILFTPRSRRLLLVRNDGYIQNLLDANSWPYQSEQVTSSIHTGVAYQNGAVYLCDASNHRVLRIKNKNVEVLAGNGIWPDTAAPDGIRAVDAQIATPTGIAVASDGTVYFAENDKWCIRKISPNGILSTVAGVRGLTNMVPVDGEVRLINPIGLALLNENELVATSESGCGVQKINISTGEITELIASKGAIEEPSAVAVSLGVPFVIGRNPAQQESNDFSPLSIFRVESMSAHVVRPPLGNSELDIPHWLGSSPSIGAKGGRLYFQSWNQILVEMNWGPDRTRRRIAGTVSGTLRNVTNISVNPLGEIVIADPGSDQAFLQRRGGPLTIVAGNGENRFVGSAENATKVPLDTIWDIEWAGENSAFVSTRSKNPVIQRFNFGGRLETVYDGGPIPEGAGPFGLTYFHTYDLQGLPNGDLVFRNTYDRSMKVVKADGRVEPFSEWDAIGWPDFVADFMQDFVATVRRGGEVLLFQGAELAVRIPRSELETVIDPSEERIIDSCIDENRNIYFCTTKKVFRQNAFDKKLRTIAGSGGVFFDGTSRDASLSAVRGLYFHKTLGLLILETDQVKQIPPSRLQSL